MIRIFEADNRRRFWEMSNCEQRQRDECALGKIAGFDDVLAFSCAQGDRTMARTWRLKKDCVELRNPALQLLVE